MHFPGFKIDKEKYLPFTVDEKLHWAFKLYDKDGSGEIDPEEMEEIFTKLCSLVTVERRMEDREREKQEERKNLILAAKLKLQKEQSCNFKLMSSKLINRTKRKEEKQRGGGRRTNLRKSQSSHHLSLPARTEDDLSSSPGSDLSSSTEQLSARSGGGARLSLDSGVCLECPRQGCLVRSYHD